MQSHLCLQTWASQAGFTKTRLASTVSSGIRLKLGLIDIFKELLDEPWWSLHSLSIGFKLNALHGIRAWISEDYGQDSHN